MKLIIDEELLQKEGLTLGEYIALLMADKNIDYKEVANNLVKKKKAYINVYDNSDKAPLVLPDSTKLILDRIRVNSDPMLEKAAVDFKALAEKLQDVYPSGNKAGTSYPWRGSTDDIIYLLKRLVVDQKFYFSAYEAIRATKEYVNSFEDKNKMKLLMNFIYYIHPETWSSDLMTIIENNRNKNESNNR